MWVLITQEKTRKKKNQGVGRGNSGSLDFRSSRNTPKVPKPRETGSRRLKKAQSTVSEVKIRPQQGSQVMKQPKQGLKQVLGWVFPSPSRSPGLLPLADSLSHVSRAISDLKTLVVQFLEWCFQQETSRAPFQSQ